MNHELLPILQNKYHGAQDKHLNNFNGKIFSKFHKPYLVEPREMCENDYEYRQGTTGGMKNEEFTHSFRLSSRLSNRFTSHCFTDIKININKKKYLEFTKTDFFMVEVEVGGQRIDRTYDITQLEMNLLLHGEKIEEDEENITFSVVCFENIYPTFLLIHHEIIIRIITKQVIGREEIKLIGKAYWHEDRERITHAPVEYYCIQTQFCGKQQITKGTNEISLYFNHPVFMVYFYGIDKSKLINYKLVLDDVILYDSANNNTLQSNDFSMNGKVTNISFTEPLDLTNIYGNKTINFSRIDKPKLIIETEQETGNIYAVGMNIGIIRVMSGMLGLAFSK